MSRNGSGVYTLPPGINPVTQDTTITSNWANTTLSDIAAALTQSLARDGQTVPVANLPMGGFRHTGVGNPTARNQYASLGWVQDGHHIRLTSVGGTNDVSGQLIGNTTTLQTGQLIQVTPTATNTGDVTLNVNSIGPKQVVRPDGEQLDPGEWAVGYPHLLVYDGTKFVALTALPETATRWPTFNEVTDKPSAFPPDAHTHTIGDVTGLQTDLNSKWDTSAATAAGLTQTTSLRISDWDSLLGGTSGFVSGTGSASNAPFGNASSGVYSAYSASAGFVLAFSGANDEVYARTAATSGGWNDWKRLATDGENTFTTSQYVATTSSGSRKIELVHPTTGASGGIRVTNTPTTYVYANDGTVQLRPDAEGSTTGMLSISSTNATLRGTRIPIIFVQSSDPGSDADTGDLWIW